MIGIGGGPGLQLGGTLVVRGASGVGGGLADNELLSAPLGIKLVGVVDLGLLPGGS